MNSRTCLPWSVICCWAVLACSTALSAQEPDVKWRTDYNTARKEAQEKGVPLMIDFVTQNCHFCTELEKTFRDTSVAGLVNEKFIPLKIHADVDTQLASILNISAFPTVVFAASDGKILHTVVG